MAYQVPKKSHPWRRYKDKIEEPKKEVKKDKPVLILVEEIVGNWKNIEVYTVAFGREDKFLLTELPQARQAAWLAGLLKKIYG